MNNQEKFKKTSKLIEEANCILIGAGAGVSKTYWDISFKFNYLRCQ